MLCWFFDQLNFCKNFSYGSSVSCFLHSPQLKTTIYIRDSTFVWRHIPVAYQARKYSCNTDSEFCFRKLKRRFEFCFRRLNTVRYCRSHLYKETSIWRQAMTLQGPLLPQDSRCSCNVLTNTADPAGCLR